MKNKKTKLTIIGIVALILVTIGLTYAYWLVTKTQTNENVISSACLDISISGEKNDITLTNQYPMSDEDGMKLTPYEFTVTNNCNTSIDYQVSLETLGNEGNAIASSALKVALDDATKIFSEYTEVDTTVSNAYESRKLGMGTLASRENEGSSVTHKLRVWIDEDAPISEANKIFRSKISVTVGQGIKNASGALAYSILSNHGGEGTISEIDPTRYAHRKISTSEVNISTTSNYYYGTDYILDESTGNYMLSGTLTQATLSECRNGTKACGKYTLISSSATYESNKLSEIIDFKTSGSAVTKNEYYYANEFSAITKDGEYGIYSAEDDYGISYYFRGDVENNYVKFGMWNESSSDGVVGCYVDYDDQSCVGNIFETLEECEADTTYQKCKELKYADKGNDMYWRIVRINGNGTIRLVYDGTLPVNNGTAHFAIIGTSAYNLNKDNPKYVGYTYEGTNESGETVQVDSTIKGVVDKWYENNLEVNYGKYITNEIFCNDRSGERTYGGITYYAPYDRLENGKTPSLKCANKTDRYTVDDITNGNGKLLKPVGLMTADEVAMAGARNSLSNSNFYLYTDSVVWLISPWGVSSYGASVYTLKASGELGSQGNVDDIYGVRPVINLKADVEFTGSGTIDDPYVIVTE